MLVVGFRDGVERDEVRLVVPLPRDADGEDVRVAMFRRLRESHMRHRDHTP